MSDGVPPVPPIVDAVLFEGSLLYPYRPAALKNLHRYPFGTLYPEAFCRDHATGDAASLMLQCLLLDGGGASVSIRLRFLQLAADPAVPPLVRDVVATDHTDPSAEEHRSFQYAPLSGSISVTSALLQPGVRRLTVAVRNTTEFAGAPSRSRDDALAHALASPHLLLTARGGEFASLIDPPEEIREPAAACRSRGTWPVLLGAPGTNRSAVLLAAPIILYDHPAIAPESPGDFFDGTEIDELLTLRLLTLTDEEKREIAAAGGAAGALLARTETLGIGATVRLHPGRRGDVFDFALAGKVATVRAVERDYEGRTFLAVTLNDDPGQHLGPYGHRFFMRPDEVEPV